MKYIESTCSFFFNRGCLIQLIGRKDENNEILRYLTRKVKNDNKNLIVKIIICKWEGE